MKSTSKYDNNNNAKICIAQTLKNLRCALATILHCHYEMK